MIATAVGVAQVSEYTNKINSLAHTCENMMPATPIPTIPARYETRISRASDCCPPFSYENLL